VVSRSVESRLFHKHLFLEGQTRPIPAPQNQALARADSGEFLEGAWSARQAVPTPMPSCSEMTFHEAPAARRVATCLASTAVRGRPNRFPLDLAAAKPLRTRERMSSRSNSAMLAKMPNTSRPFGVEVSTPVQTDELNPHRPELFQCVHQLAKASSEPVVAIHHHGIHLPLAAVHP